LPTLLKSQQSKDAAKFSATEPMKVPIHSLSSWAPDLQSNQGICVNHARAGITFVPPPGLENAVALDLPGSDAHRVGRLQLRLCTQSHAELQPESGALATLRNLRSAGGVLKLGELNARDFEVALQAVLPVAAKLALTERGRDEVEQLLEAGARAQKLALAEQLRHHVLEISMDAQGCWVIQKALDVLPRDASVKLVSGLSAGAMECMESKHGNFVAQACVERLPPDSIAFFVAAIETKVKHVACHKYGCRVLQRLLEHLPRADLAAILEALAREMVDLSQNQYGCHVLRVALDYARLQDKLLFFEIARRNIERMTRGRLATMVLDKCVEVATEGEHAASLRDARAELTHDVFFGCGGKASEAPFVQMSTSRYGRCALRHFLSSAQSVGEAEALHRRMCELLSEGRVRAIISRGQATS